MKIWTITTDQDGEAPATHVHTTRESVKDHFARIVAASWEKHANADDHGPMPEDAEEAYDALCEISDFFDQITLGEHDISDHPAITKVEAEMAELEDRMGDSEEAACNDDTMAIVRDYQIRVSRALTEDEQTSDDPLNDIIEAFRSAARRDHEVEGELEFDDAPKVSIGADGNGAYVAAWRWISNDEAGVPDPDEACRTCGETYADGGDGFDGECPICADKSVSEFGED